MAQFDLVQAQTFLRQQANEPAKKLRRQATGAALFLLIGGGYALYHAAGAKSEQEARPAAMPVAVESLKAARHFKHGPAAYEGEAYSPWKKPIEGPWFQGFPGKQH